MKADLRLLRSYFYNYSKGDKSIILQFKEREIDTNIQCDFYSNTKNSIFFEGWVHRLLEEVKSISNRRMVRIKLQSVIGDWDSKGFPGKEWRWRRVAKESWQLKDGAELSIGWRYQAQLRSKVDKNLTKRRKRKGTGSPQLQPRSVRAEIMSEWKSFLVQTMFIWERLAGSIFYSGYICLEWGGSVQWLL